MLASEILRRIIMAPTTTAVRAFPDGADVATISAAGQVLGGALACGNISAADVAALGALSQRALLVPIVFATPEIDYTLTAPQTVPFTNAVIAGKKFLTFGNANIVRSILTVVAGTLTTQPLYLWGNNSGTIDNYSGSTPAIAVTTAQFNAGAGASASGAGIANTLIPLDLSNGMAAKITTAAAGAGTTCKGKLYFPGFLI